MNTAGIDNLHIIDGMMDHKNIEILKKNLHVTTQKLKIVDILCFLLYFQHDILNIQLIMQKWLLYNVSNCIHLRNYRFQFHWAFV